ncbi:MAG: hypothetical protein ACYCZF_00220 [Anaerolineae bacterium]
MRKWIALIIVILVSAFVLLACQPTLAPTLLYPTITPGQTQAAATGVSPKGETPQATSTTPSFPTGPLTLTVSDILDLSFINTDQGWLLGADCEMVDGACQRWPVLLRKTGDGGHSWAALPAPVAVTGYSSPSTETLRVSRVLFCSESDGWLYGPSAFSTTDGGNTWVKAQSDILAMAVMSNTLWAVQADVGGVWNVATSSDHGRTWLKSPNQPQWLDSLPQLVALNDQQAWVMANVDFTWYLWATTDGGATWTELSSPTAPYRAMRVLQVTPDGTLWLFSADQPTTATQNKALYKSLDGASTWIVVATPPHDAQTLCKLPSLGHLTSAHQVAVTSDGAFFIALQRYTLLRSNSCDWTEAIPAAEANLGDATISSVTFVDYMHGWAPAPPNRLFITSNGGDTWQMVTVP